MSDLPCKNTACHSYGKPHPNCRCYPNMAEGGDVGFCSSTREHLPGCEYFVDGGDVIDPSSVTPDPPAAAPAPEAAPPAAEVIDPGAVTPDPPAAGEAIDPSSVTLDEPHEPQPELPPAGAPIPQAAFDQTARQREDAAKWALMMPGIGGVGIAAKAAEMIPGIAKLATMGHLGSLGSAVIKNGIASGLIQGADEASKMIMGEGDPSDAVGSVIAAGGAGALFGLAGKGAAALGRAGVNKLVETKASGKLASFLIGVGQASGEAEPGMREEFNKHFKQVHDELLGDVGGDWQLYKKGQAFFDQLVHGRISGATKEIARTVGTSVGSTLGGTSGAVIGQQLGAIAGEPLGHLLEKLAVPATKKVALPVTMKIFSSGRIHDLLNVMQHAEQMNSGFDMVANAANQLVLGGSNALIKYAKDDEKAREKTKNYIEKGGSDQDLQNEIYRQNAAPPAQGFAEGGDVAPAPEPTDTAPPVPLSPMGPGAAAQYPEQNILMNAAKARVSSYLTSLAPAKNPPSLAFDDPPDTREQMKSYHKAIDIANRPLSVLDHIKSGTLEPEHIKHLNAMYPETNQLIQKQLTKAVVKAQMEGKKPSYHIRQGLSLMMGAPLSGEFSPANIQAAQATFAQAKAQQQQQSAPAKKRSSGSKQALSKSDQAYLTDSQARQQRQQRG